MTCDPRDLIESGQVTPEIDRTYPLGDAAAAIRTSARSRRGKVVITASRSHRTLTMSLHDVSRPDQGAAFFFFFFFFLSKPLPFLVWRAGSPA